MYWGKENVTDDHTAGGNLGPSLQYLHLAASGYKGIRYLYWYPDRSTEGSHIFQILGED